MSPGDLGPGIGIIAGGGRPVHIVAARLGDDPATVLSTYAHLLPQSDELAAERVAEAIDEPPSPPPRIASVRPKRTL